MSINSLDAATTGVVHALIEAFRGVPWKSLRCASRWTPRGDVGAADFWLSNGGEEVKTMPALAATLAVSNAAKQHWQLTQTLGQPRWYKMTVKVEHTGRFNVDFEYRDHYREGDIMREQG